MQREQKITELGMTIRFFPLPDMPFTYAHEHNGIVFVSGHTPTIEGVPQYKGVVGQEVDLETAQQAAVLCLENCLGALQQAVGGLDRVKKIIKVNGFVASAPGFDKQALVMNAVSERLNAIFGEKHARAALGVAMLPGGVPVEVELIAAI